MAEYGDPRGGKVDPIDWVESIPFQETRQYVQKVLQNTQVYRARLAPETMRAMTADLRRGGPTAIYVAANENKGTEILFRLVPSAHSSRAVTSASGYRSVHFQTDDGLRLFARDYSSTPSALTPLLCLPGLTRNSKDFETIAPWLAQDAARHCSGFSWPWPVAICGRSGVLSA